MASGWRALTNSNSGCNVVSQWRPDSRLASRRQVCQTHRTHTTQGIIFADVFYLYMGKGSKTYCTAQDEGTFPLKITSSSSAIFPTTNSPCLFGKVDMGVTTITIVTIPLAAPWRFHTHRVTLLCDFKHSGGCYHTAKCSFFPLTFHPLSDACS